MLYILIGIRICKDLESGHKVIDDAKLKYPCRFQAIDPFSFDADEPPQGTFLYAQVT